MTDCVSVSFSKALEGLGDTAFLSLTIKHFPFARFQKFDRRSYTKMNSMCFRSSQITWTILQIDWSMGMTFVGLKQPSS